MRHILLLTIVFFLSACTQAPPPPPAPVKTVIDDQLRALDKAAATEQQILDQAKAQSDEIDRQTQ